MGMRPTSAHALPSSISVPQPSIQHSAGTPHSRQHLPHEGQKTKQTEGNPKNQPRCRNRRKLTTTNTILSERRRCTVWRGKAGAAQRSQGWEVPQPSRPCPCTCLLHTLGGGGHWPGAGARARAESARRTGAVSQSPARLCPRPSTSQLGVWACGPRVAQAGRPAFAWCFARLPAARPAPGAGPRVQKGHDSGRQGQAASQ